MTEPEQPLTMEGAVNQQLALAIEPQEFDSPEYIKDPFPLDKRLRDHHCD